MAAHEIRTLQGLGECLVLTFEDESEHIMPLEAIGAWGELLGMDDAGDVVDAMLYVAERGEPEPDPVTGENAWTPAYVALQKRVNAAARAVEEKRAPSFDAAALNTDSEGVVAGQAETRDALNLPEVTPWQPVPLRALMGRPAPASGLDAAKQALNERGTDIARARQAFQDELRGH